MSALAANGGEKSPFRGRHLFLRGRKWPQVDPRHKKTRSMSGSLEVLAEREGFEKLTRKVIGNTIKVIHIKNMPDLPLFTNIHRRVWRYTGLGRKLVAFAIKARIVIKNCCSHETTQTGAQQA